MITSSTLLSIWVLMINATIIECLLCALYYAMYFAYIISFISCGRNTTTIKMKNKVVKYTVQEPGASKQKG